MLLLPLLDSSANFFLSLDWFQILLLLKQQWITYCKWTKTHIVSIKHKQVKSISTWYLFYETLEWEPFFSRLPNLKVCKMKSLTLYCFLEATNTYYLVILWNLFPDCCVSVISSVLSSHDGVCFFFRLTHTAHSFETLFWVIKNSYLFGLACNIECFVRYFLALALITLIKWHYIIHLETKVTHIDPRWNDNLRLVRIHLAVFLLYSF